MPSKDTENDRCEDVLRIGDDYGDNECSFRCMLETNHSGPHKDEFEHEWRLVVVVWHAGEKED